MADAQSLARVSAEFLLAATPHRPSVGVVLGSGLGDLADRLPNPVVFTAAEVPGFPAMTIEGHRGRLVFTSSGEGAAVFLQGRAHYYESGELDRVLHPVRVLAELGVRTLILTNAAGGVGRHLRAGDLMVISDQIDMTFRRLPAPSHVIPLRQSMTFDPDLAVHALSVADQAGVRLHTGTYCGVLGPSYETAAEVRMIGRIGGDAVGMSTVLEAAQAAQLGMRVLGLSCITNMGTGLSQGRLDHGEVTATAAGVKDAFSRLVLALVASFQNYGP